MIRLVPTPSLPLPPPLLLLLLLRGKWRGCRGVRSATCDGVGGETPGVRVAAWQPAVMRCSGETEHPDGTECDDTGKEDEEERGREREE
ncbi:unnamed protein product [Lampetra planeri]